MSRIASRLRRVLDRAGLISAPQPQPSGARRRVACLTMLKDETFFFPIWYRYYSGLFGAENIFVIDDNSAEPVRRPRFGAQSRQPLNLLRIPFDAEIPSRTPRRNPFDVRRFTFISNLVHGLLTRYDTVIFNDTDEIFVTDPSRYADLRAFLEDPKARFPAVAGLGLDLCHLPSEEPAFDVRRPVLHQRRHFVYAPLYSKPHILSRRIAIGGHGVDGPFRLHPALYLLHLRYVDLPTSLRRQEARHEAYLRGLGGANSDWRQTPDEFAAAYDTLVGLPRGPQRMPHKDILPHFYDGSAGQVVGVPDGPPRQRAAKRKDRTELVDFLTAEERAQLGRTLNTLPPRFRDTVS